VGLRICEQLFWTWEIYQHTGDRRSSSVASARCAASSPIMRTYAATQARYRHTRGMARNLLKLWPALWTFADHKGVQPTNNHAERALRGSVIYRKLSLGTQSDDGERRIQRLLSIHTTCRLQRRALHDYLIDALTAHSRGDPVPLLP
jgi:transposase